ncbi:MAG: ParB N-terminal domain-containing protein [Deltaproteobacteria bacterium]|nr:ParB N-terminal domain-containing protein [Deltaproteobacteria bacterium]
MTKLPRAALPIFSALALAALSLSAFGDYSTYTVDLNKVHPTQMQVGMAAVRIVSQNTYVDSAIGDDAELADFKSQPSGDKKNPLPPRKSLSELSPAQRTRLHDKLAAYLAQNPPEPVRAVRGPDGSIYITDGHHRTTALEVLTLEGAPPLVDSKKAQIRVTIGDSGNYQGRPDDFIDFVSRTGFFTRDVRERFQHKELTASQLVGLLPKTMADMVHSDLPLRSTVGKVFFDLGIKGDPFDDYLEFFIGEQIDCESGSTQGHEFDEATLERTRRAIFGNPDVLAYLRTKESPEPKKAIAEAQIAKAISKYNIIEAERASKGVPDPAPLTCTATKPASEMVEETVNLLRAKKPGPSLNTVEQDNTQKQEHSEPTNETAAEGPGADPKTSFVKPE